MISSEKVYSGKEELANSLTHGLGIILSVSGLVLMIVFSALNGNKYHITGSTIYGASLVLLYTMSTMYHMVQRPKIKKIFRVLDHSSIFILIAGTYTPFTLVNLHGSWGWTLFGLVWGLAVVGIIFELYIKQRFKKLSLGLYIVMGWLILIALKPLLLNVDTNGIILLLIGGFSYTFGIIFYTWKSLFYSHAIWHLFVLLGSVLHFFAVFFYVIP